MEYLTEFELEEDLILGGDDASDDLCICICKFPSTDDLITCTGPECPIVWYHKKCAGLDPGYDTDIEPSGPASAQAPVSDRWLCDLCYEQHQQKTQTARMAMETTSDSSKKEIMINNNKN